MKRKRLNKKANILTENIIFIVLNLVFLTILILFLFLKMSDVSFLEERYAKQIALIIDSAKLGMDISLDMGNAVEKAKDKKWEDKIVSIEDNIVTVKLHEKGGYSYSFFNNIELNKTYHYVDEGNEFNFKIEKWKNEEQIK